MKWVYNKRKLHDNREWKDSHTTTNPTFCAWDGESYNKDGIHTYFLLANSHGESIVNMDGLSTEQCLTFMLESSVKGEVNVGYAFSYDVNMLLRDVPKDRLIRLYKGMRVRLILNGKWFYIRWLSRKELQISNFRRKSTRRFSPMLNRAIPDNPRSVVIWDTIGFFQCSFVKALEQYLPGQIATQEMESWKQKRSTFSLEEIEGIKAYCFSELAAMIQLMDKLAENLATVGLHLARWDGAGSVAGTMMRKYKVNEHQNHNFPAVIGRWSQYAYSGGRIECVRIGHYWDTCTLLDINSAYPSVLIGLPSLRQGEWVYSESFKPTTFSIWWVKWNIHADDWEDCHKQRIPGSHLIYPFFYRKKDGSILYPPSGEGKYWCPEVEVALKWHMADVMVIGGYVWKSQASEKPYAWLVELYEQRRKWKELGNGAQMVAKLGMNSLYGKNAQSVGGYAGKPPSTHQLEWAGYVTSQTRAKLYDVAKANEDRLIYLATDGIGLVGSPMVQILPDIGSRLGQWDMQEVGGLTSVKSGIYFVEKMGKEFDSNPKPKTRGYDPGTVTMQKIIEAWSQERDYLLAPNTRFIGLGFAVSTGRWDLWRTWVTQHRKLDFLPAGKRQPMQWQAMESLSKGTPFAGYNLQTEFMPTRAAHVVHGFAAHPTKDLHIKARYQEPEHSDYYALPWITGGSKSDKGDGRNFADEEMER